MPKLTTLKDVRKHNQYKILQQIYHHGTLSRLEVARKTGLSPATTGTLLLTMLEDGIVQETGFKESQGGRRQVLLEINRDYGLIVGIDIGHTYFEIEVYNFGMELITTKKVMYPENMFEDKSITDLITDEYKILFKENSIDADKVLGIGLALPGLVNVKTQKFVWGKKIPWSDVDYKSILENSLGKDIYMDNGANGMAMAEQWLGVGKSYDNILFTVVGRGVGAGIINEGKIYRGHANYTGEWGHFIVRYSDGEEMNGIFSIEDIMSTKLSAFWKKKGREDYITSVDPLVEVQTLKVLADSGDKEALDIVDCICEILGIGLANIVNLINPEVIILGSWMGIELFDYLKPGIKTILSTYGKYSGISDIEIIKGSIGKGESCVGAGCLVLNNYLGHQVV